MDQNFMKEKKVLPLVLSMSLPMMLSMLINSLYNIIDSMFVARVGEKALTAISLVYPLQTLVTSISVGFGVGISAAVAFFLGMGEHKKADQSASEGLFLSIVHGVLTVSYTHLDVYKRQLEGKVDLHMLNAIAASLDLELSEGSLEEQYDTLKSCLMTLERYECNRLR